MQLIRTNVTVHGQPADIHIRLLDYGTLMPVQNATHVAFCGVYVRPVPSVVDPAQPLVPGYWTFPEGAEAAALLTSVGVTL